MCGQLSPKHVWRLIPETCVDITKLCVETYHQNMCGDTFSCVGTHVFLCGDTYIYVETHV